MDINLGQIENALEKGLELVQQLAPLAALGGPAAAAIGTTVSSVAATAQAVVQAVEADATIIASGDTARIKALQTQLQAENDALDSQLDAS